MPTLQGTIQYPGLDNIQGATVTWGHGITPGAFTIRMAPQSAVPAATGAVTMRFGNQLVSLRDCKIDQITYSRDGATVLSVTILDRRWKWAFGAISGQYNLRNADATVKGAGGRDERAAFNSERTPQQLAALCLEAMGERSFDVGQLPNNTRPEVDWDYVNPAAALAELCDALGCRVVLTLDDRVVLYRLGAGRGLPAGGPIHRREATIDPAEMPNELAILCGPSLYQVDLLLDAMAEEPDGSIVSLDDVSYKPADGWGSIDFPEFNAIQDQALREIAKRSVFRYYRPRMPAEIPGWRGKQADALAQLLPLGTVQVDSTTDPSGEQQPKPAYLFGVWSAEGGDSENQAELLEPVDDDQDETCVREFRIDQDRGLVITADYLYKLEGTMPNMTFAPAELVLRTAVTVRDVDTMAIDRYAKVLPNRGQRFGTKTRYVPHEEIRLTHRCDYLPRANGRFVSGRVDTNRRDVDAECDYYLAQEAAQYRTLTPETVTFAGLHAIELDGLIQRVTWNVGAPFASTTVDVGRDVGTPDAIPYRMMRGLEKMKAAADKALQADRRRKKNHATIIPPRV